MDLSGAAVESSQEQFDAMDAAFMKKQLDSYKQLVTRLEDQQRTTLRENEQLKAVYKSFTTQLSESLPTESSEDPTTAVEPATMVVEELGQQMQAQLEHFKEAMSKMREDVARVNSRRTEEVLMAEISS
jgi:DnaJ-domain-containing protein 1